MEGEIKPVQFLCNDVIAEWEARQIIVLWGVGIWVLPVMLRGAIYGGVRAWSRVECRDDKEIECSSDKRLTDVVPHLYLHGQPLIVAVSLESVVYVQTRLIPRPHPWEKITGLI